MKLHKGIANIIASKQRYFQCVMFQCVNYPVNPQEKEGVKAGAQSSCIVKAGLSGFGGAVDLFCGHKQAPS